MWEVWYMNDCGDKILEGEFGSPEEAESFINYWDIAEYEYYIIIEKDKK